MSLTQVKAKRKELKVALVDAIRDHLDKFSSAYVFSFDNMRTQHFKDLRGAMAGDSRFFLGKNRIMQKALGASAADEFRPRLGQLGSDLKGNVGLLLTNRSRAEVDAALRAHEQPDFARAGCVAPRDVAVPRGPIGMPHTMVEELRKLGMANLRLDKGTPTLPSEYRICSAGDALTPEQCRLLKHFGHQLAVFQLHLLSHWRDGVYEVLDASRRRGAAAASGTGEMAEDDDDDDDDEGGDDGN